jgi:hypothetical protein
VDRHGTSLEHIILIPSQPFFALSSLCCVLGGETTNTAQTLSRMNSLSGRMNIVQVNIEFFTRCKKIKQRRISFVLGYLRMIL